jgi:hypothetical protein
MRLEFSNLRGDKVACLNRASSTASLISSSRACISAAKVVDNVLG